VLAVIGGTGMFLAGRNNKWGWALGVGAQFLWMAYGIVMEQYGFCATAILYGFIQSKNFLKWHKASRDKDEVTA
jgi:hypothetical protein